MSQDGRGRYLRVLRSIILTFDYIKLIHLTLVPYFTLKMPERIGRVPASEEELLFEPNKKKRPSLRLVGPAIFII